MTTLTPQQPMNPFSAANKTAAVPPVQHEQQQIDKTLEAWTRLQTSVNNVQDQLRQATAQDSPELQGQALEFYKEQNPQNQDLQKIEALSQKIQAQIDQMSGDTPQLPTEKITVELSTGTIEIDPGDVANDLEQSIQNVEAALTEATQPIIEEVQTFFEDSGNIQKFREFVIEQREAEKKRADNYEKTLKFWAKLREDRQEAWELEEQEALLNEQTSQAGQTVTLKQSHNVTWNEINASLSGATVTKSLNQSLGIGGYLTGVQISAVQDAVVLAQRLDVGGYDSPEDARMNKYLQAELALYSAPVVKAAHSILHNQDLSII